MLGGREVAQGSDEEVDVGEPSPSDSKATSEVLTNPGGNSRGSSAEASGDGQAPATSPA